MVDLIDLARDNWRRLAALMVLVALAFAGVFMLCGGDDTNALAADDGGDGVQPGPTLTLAEAVSATIEAREATTKQAGADVQATLTVQFLNAKAARDEAVYVHPWTGDGSGVLSEADYEYVKAMGPAVFPAVRAHLLLDGLLMRLPSRWSDPIYADELEWVEFELGEARLRVDRVVGDDEEVSEELRAYGRNLQSSLGQLDGARQNIAAGVSLVNRAGSWESLNIEEREELNGLYWTASGHIEEFRSLLERHGCLACGEVYR